MTATASLDIKQPPRISEDRGAVREARARYLVKNLDTSTEGLARLLEALQATDLPGYGDPLSGFANLVLVEREVEMLPDSNENAWVNIKWAPIGESGEGFWFSGDSGLRTIERATDANGNLMYTTYNGVDQGGTVSAPVPTFSVVATGIIEDDFPMRVQERYLGRINFGTWMGLSTGKWMCTGAPWKPLDWGVSPKRSVFTFSFEAIFLGHNHDVWYIDPETGRPPADLVPGVGLKNYRTQAYANFGELFDMDI